MSALSNTDAVAESRVNLSHVYDAGDADDLQVAVVVRRLAELVLLLRAPGVGSRTPAENHKV